MYLVSRAVWFLVGSLAYLGAVVNAAGVLEIDVVFPRTNETYAPTDKFPIVFALQNAGLAKHLTPSIHSSVRNGSNLESGFGNSIHDLTYANYSSEPYFVYHYVNVDTEGPLGTNERLVLAQCWPPLLRLRTPAGLRSTQLPPRACPLFCMPHCAKA